jgi:hypothetical protein
MKQAAAIPRQTGQPRPPFYGSCLKRIRPANPAPSPRRSDGRGKDTLQRDPCGRLCPLRSTYVSFGQTQALQGWRWTAWEHRSWRLWLRRSHKPWSPAGPHDFRRSHVPRSLGSALGASQPDHFGGSSGQEVISPGGCFCRTRGAQRPPRARPCRDGERHRRESIRGPEKRDHPRTFAVDEEDSAK